MHTYEPLQSLRDPIPSIAGFRFHDALDVVRRAQHDRLIGWSTWPEVWHLDDNGEMRCYYAGSTGESIRRWADDPSSLLWARYEGMRVGGCTRRWVIVESRNCWIEDALVNEGDAQSFLRVREHLAAVGVQLLDVVIFDADCHWWSMQELTTGSTRWPS